MSILLINADGTYTIPVSEAAITGVTTLPASSPTQYVLVNEDGSYTIPEVNSTAYAGDVKTVGRPTSEFTTKGAVTYIGSVGAVAGIRALKTAQHVGKTSTVAGISAPYTIKNYSSTLFTGNIRTVGGVAAAIGAGTFVVVEGIKAVAAVEAGFPEVVTGVGEGAAELQFLDDSLIVGGVGATGTAFIQFEDILAQGVTAAVAASSAYLEFAAATITAFEGDSTGFGADLQLLASGSGFGGCTAAGVGLEEFSYYSAIANAGVTASSSGFIYISANGSGYSEVVLTPDNEAVLDVLALPIVAFSMNVLTKGFSAYTDNVNEKVLPLVSTPVSNLGSKRKKRVRDLYAHMRSTGDVGVSTITDEVKSRVLTSTIPYDCADGVHTQRAKLSRGTEGVNWQFYLEGGGADSFDVEFIEVVPTISESRTS